MSGRLGFIQQADHDAGGRRLSRKLSERIVDPRLRNILQIADAYRRGLAILDRRRRTGHAGVDACALERIRNDENRAIVQPAQSGNTEHRLSELDAGQSDYLATRRRSSLRISFI